ncbi:hypothetical protein [Kineococcus sp. SYSU DK003]
MPHRLTATDAPGGPTVRLDRVQDEGVRWGTRTTWPAELVQR